MLDVVGYLRRLGVTRSGTPSAEELFALHRAHVATVPYENLEIQLGRTPSIDPVASVQRIVTGYGGYCYHLNGAFSELLAALGYDVTRHVGGVSSRLRPKTDIDGGHLALTVRVDGQAWFVDVGLGNALYEPMPLRAGDAQQGPFRYRLEPSASVEGRWRFWNAPNAESFTSMDFTEEPVGMDAFATMHQHLCTAPNSNFVTVAQVALRSVDGYDFITGCYLRTCDRNGMRKTLLTSADQWFGALADVFGMPLADVDPPDRAALWNRLWSAHEGYVASLSNLTIGDTTPA